MSAVRIRADEVEFEAVRAQGPGGQNVNKVANAVQLRFRIAASSLPDEIKSRLIALHDRRIGAGGVVVIKAQRFRSLEMNRVDALARLQALVDRAAAPPPPRVPTRPTRASVQRRLADKAQRGSIKAARRTGGE